MFWSSLHERWNFDSLTLLDLKCKWSKIFSNFLLRAKWAEKVLGNSFKTWKRIKSRLESFDQLFDIVRWTFLEISQNFSIFKNVVFHSQLWLQQTIIFIVKWYKNTFSDWLVVSWCTTDFYLISQSRSATVTVQVEIIVKLQSISQVPTITLLNLTFDLANICAIVQIMFN